MLVEMCMSIQLFRKQTYYYFKFYNPLCWDLIDEMEEVMLLHKKQCQGCYLFHFIF